MHPEHLLNASKLIARTNLTEKVRAVRVQWDGKLSSLAVTYYVEGPPTEAEEAECELTVGELLAEFTDIETARAQCLDCKSAAVDPGKLDGLVYLRAGEAGAEPMHQHEERERHASSRADHRTSLPGRGWGPLQYPDMRTELREYLQGLSDIEYQQRVWVRGEAYPGIEHDQFDYAIHFLFDDTSLAVDPEAAIGVLLVDEQEARAVHAVTRAIDALLCRYGTSLDDAAYLAKPEWARVVQTAKAALQALDRGGV